MHRCRFRRDRHFRIQSAGTGLPFPVRMDLHNGKFHDPVQTDIGSGRFQVEKDDRAVFCKFHIFTLSFNIFNISTAYNTTESPKKKPASKILLDFFVMRDYGVKE